MPIDFHAPANRHSYATRDADPAWAAAMRSLVDPAGRLVADVGCGGGIYSLAWHALGATAVTGVDFSAQMVATARERAAGVPGLVFVQGEAAATGLQARSQEIVFARALIHHLQDLRACFAEARRILAPGGVLIVQDRTPDDVDQPGSPTHFRGWFFDRFPRLRAVEAGRRPTQEAVAAAMHAAGMADLRQRTLWETRRIYAGFDELAADLAARTGRSLLHELDDAELQALVGHLRERLPAGQPIVEQDRWTLWSARAPGP